MLNLDADFPFAKGATAFCISGSAGFCSSIFGLADFSGCGFSGSDLVEMGGVSRSGAAIRNFFFLNP